jgi:hypothetical protein
MCIASDKRSWLEIDALEEPVALGGHAHWSPR